MSLIVPTFDNSEIAIHPKQTKEIEENKVIHQFL